QGPLYRLSYLTMATAPLVTQFAAGLVLRDVSWQREQDSNLRPADLESAALPTELSLHESPVFSALADWHRGSLVLVSSRSPAARGATLSDSGAGLLGAGWLLT